MARVALVSMPIARVEFPSLALTQLDALLKAQCGGRVETTICYANQDFAARVGVEINQTIADMSMNNGVGEWFFRAAAFPEQPDNASAYFQRFYPHGDAATRRLRAEILARRADIDDFLDDVIARYRLAEARIVGFTSMFSQNVASIALARRLKAIDASIVTVVGGANCEHPMGEILARRVASLDYVFSGPALRTFPRFVEHILAGDRAAAAALPGVFTAAASSPSPIGPELPIDADIALDYDAFLDDYDARFAGRAPRPALLFETSRGCWWGEKAHCTFCGLNGMTMKYRSMRPDRAVAMIRDLFRYADRAELQSVDNILPRNYLAEVLAHLDTPQTTSLFYEIKADLGDADFAALEQARVRFVQPGVESLATATLKRMKKGTTAFQNIALLKRCALHDIDPAWNLLVGFPGEPAEVYAKYVDDLPRLTHLPAPIGVSPVRFDRYSPYFTKAADYGLELKPFDFYRLTYPFDEAEIGSLAYYFYDDAVDAPYIVDLVDWIQPLREAVAAWREAWPREGGARRVLHRERGRDGRERIVDDRSGARREHVVDAGLAATLDALEKPMSLARLRGELDGVDVEAAVAFLDREGMLFREHDRMMSLVLPRPPKAPETWRDARNPAAVA